MPNNPNITGLNSFSDWNNSDIEKANFLESLKIHESAEDVAEKWKIGEYLYAQVHSLWLLDVPILEARQETLGALAGVVHSLGKGVSLEQVKGVIDLEMVQIKEQGVKGISALNWINNALQKAGMVDKIYKMGMIAKLWDLSRELWTGQERVGERVEWKKEIREKEALGMEKSKMEMQFNVNKEAQGGRDEQKAREEEQKRAQAEAQKKADEENEKLYQQAQENNKRFQKQQMIIKSQTTYQKKKKGIWAGVLTGGAVGGAGLVTALMQIFG